MDIYIFISPLTVSTTFEHSKIFETLEIGEFLSSIETSDWQNLPQEMSSGDIVESIIHFTFYCEFKHHQPAIKGEINVKITAVDENCSCRFVVMVLSILFVLCRLHFSVL